MGNTERFSDTYDILEKLGEGSGGIVYKAYHRRLRQEVVLKKMKGKSLSAAVKRQEVDILKRLHHSYLPQVLDFFEDGGEIYTVMSYIEGKSFAQLIKEGRTFERRQLIRWGMQISSALNYLHSQTPPVIHGDIKPSNLMLTPEGNICLIDFNIAFYLDDTAVLGYSDGYTSPEQYIMVLSSGSAEAVPGHTKIDIRSDIYSAGATMYHIVTGKKLNGCKDRADKNLLIQQWGEAFAHVIGKAAEIDPDKRYQNAREMFQAFEGIAKKDKRYRRLLHRQVAVRMGLVILIAGCIILCGYGIHRMKLETVDRYNDLVEKQVDLRGDGRYDEQESVYEEASALLPGALESYFQNAYSLYEQEEYEECISFIDYDICENEDLDLNQARMADVYYLKADSSFKLGQYERAVEAYKEVFRLGTKKVEYYRDYAIALSYNGDDEGAREILQKAVDYGLKEDSIYYAKGEIEKSMGSYDAALTEFQRCAEMTDDNDMKARAYLMMETVYEEKGDNAGRREILLKARETLPAENQMQILERLAKVDIELADESEEYRLEAIDALGEIAERGWAVYSTYDTLAVLYEKQGQLDAARECIDTMLELYGEDYNIYMRYAFLEIDVQQLKENIARDYSTFAGYYEKAEKLYKQEMTDNNADDEMNLLRNVYIQVKEGGWLQ